MANLSERVIHHVNLVSSLSEVREELSIVSAYLKWIKATIMLELEISPRNGGWQIILLE